MDEQTINQAKKALNGTEWREFVKEHGTEEALRTMVAISTAKIREKGLGGSLASTTIDCLTGGLNPMDADIIFRLRSLRGKA